MISNSMVENRNIKNYSKINNKNSIKILNKTLSDINIKNKNSNNNFPSKNSLLKSTTISFKKITKKPFLKDLFKKQSSQIFNTNIKLKLKSKSVKAKDLLKKYLDDKLTESAKTSREMEKQFYLKNREILKNLGKSNALFSGIIKAHQKIVKKILLDYKNISGYDKEILYNNRNSYYRNIEYMENQEKLQENKRLKEEQKFNKLKYSENRKLFSSYQPKNTESYRSSIFSSPKYKSLMRRSSFKVPKNRKNINKLEEKVNDILIHKNYFMAKRVKENAKIFCDRVKNLDVECKLYEPINEYTCKTNMIKNNYYNVGNLDRIIKLECFKDPNYGYEDYEGNSAFLKKCSNEYNLFCDKALSGYFPCFVKKEGFLNRTLIKYGNLQGKYFGLPV